MTRREHQEYLKLQKSNSDYALEVHLVANNCCDEYSKIDEMVVEIDAEIKSPRLPYSQCKRPFTGCVCCYSVRIKFDENGRPVMK